MFLYNETRFLEKKNPICYYEKLLNFIEQKSSARVLLHENHEVVFVSSTEAWVPYLCVFRTTILRLESDDEFQIAKSDKQT